MPCLKTESSQFHRTWTPRNLRSPNTASPGGRDAEVSPHSTTPGPLTAARTPPRPTENSRPHKFGPGEDCFSSRTCGPSTTSAQNSGCCVREKFERRLLLWQRGFHEMESVPSSHLAKDFGNHWKFGPNRTHTWIPPP